MGRLPHAPLRVSGRAATRPGGPAEREGGQVVEAVEAQPAAGKHRQGIERLGVALVADAPPSAGGQPGDDALSRPALVAQPVGRLDPTVGDTGGDGPPTQVGAAGPGVIRRVAVDLARAAAPAPTQGPSRGDVVRRRANSRWSLTLAPPISSDSGSPVPSLARCSSLPGLARSIGLRPCGPPRSEWVGRLGCFGETSNRS
jgi:hypothetical protein